jgi:hypothetical protein
MKFSEKVRENFERFKEIVERKGRDVLVAGIIGAGVLVGDVKAQSADSLVVDTSSVHIDSTYIDWSKPRFMGLTYGYYYKPEKLVQHLDTLTIFKIMKDIGMSDSEVLENKYKLLGELIKTYPYSIPPTQKDTIEAIKEYFLDKYGIRSLSYSEIADYTRKYPEKAAALLADIEILKNTEYWNFVLNQRQ